MTRLVRFANNATSKLAANLSAVGLTASLTPGDGNKFPALSAGQFFLGTIVKSDGTKEVVKVTARSTDTLTIVRAFEAVAGVQTAYAFTAGDKFELRLTAEALSNELDRLDAAAFLETVTKSANYTILESDISKLIKTNTAAGNITYTLPQISTLTGSFEVQISKSTGDGNTVTINRAGSDTINGQNSYILASQYQCVWLVADLSTNTWTAITSANASNKITDQFIGAGSAGPFTLTGDPGSKNNTDVYVGGVYQNKSTYTVSGTSLTLGGVVAAGVIVECDWAQPLPVGTPSDGTVNIAKLADNVKSAIQSQTWTGFASAGTAPAYTLTPVPAIAVYAANQRFRVAAHAAGTTGSNTLNVSGLGAKNLKQYDSSGAKIPAVIAAGQLLDVEYDGTDFVVLDPLPATPPSQIRSIGASVAANALTVSASALSIDFRSTTLGNGTISTVSGTPANLVVPSAATLGTVSGQQSDIVVLALNNAGTIELAVVNIAGGVDLSETGLISTTAISAAATAANVVYSTTARTNVAYCVIGFIRSTQAMAGTWATAPSLVQGAGGNALGTMQSLGYGQTAQNVTGSRAFSTTYYNTTGKPITMYVTGAAASASAPQLSLSLNGGTSFPVAFSSVPSGAPAWGLSAIIPAGASYALTGNATSPSIASWWEVR